MYFYTQRLVDGWIWSVHIGICLFVRFYVYIYIYILMLLHPWLIEEILRRRHCMVMILDCKNITDLG